ncbi:MAG: alpha-galactosidase [Clostridium sp.]|nr:alpha-galactosidase [Clostridium sp.]MCM1399330.1 alpha-galactosidase [Clostridium sp.]MCM1460789.1 alpha-galactosidase [Bacteroides sp.]
MIQRYQQCFLLETKNTSYCFQVIQTGHLEHLYYGRRITIPEKEFAEALTEKHAFMSGNTNAYTQEHTDFSLEDIRLEMSSYGKGDIREPFVEIIHADGSYTSDFLFENAEITKGKEEYQTLPGSYDDKGTVDHLCITLKDKQYSLTLELHYYVYEDCDVITRSARLMNESHEEIKLTRLMSAQLDFDTPEYVFTTFTGAWAREMKRTDVKMLSGKHVNASYTGTSSSRANPFVMLSKEETSEDSGDCYGFHLIYSGNHYEAVEVSGYGKTRIVAGINPQSFCYLLGEGECFEAPEVVMSYSHQGFNGMSQHMHGFVREHIVRGTWKHKVRPILLNSWEAAYFDIDERKLLSLAKAGKEAGIELFVMDDGWFGTRDDDTQALGDWDANRKKLPHGLKGLATKIKELGLLFGIWVEPEMVNVNSRLYEQHPDWVLAIPGKPHSEGRNQRILDLTRKEVQDYVIEQMSRIFSSADISYVKWDMNRTVTDYFSAALPPERQGEVAHRYVLGLYRCMKELTERFPHILFEGCAAGGNRFDLGILCYFPQIWASDDTDALCRAEIQTGYSYGYPMSVVSAHVSSCPNHQTLRNTPLETRFHVAAFGICGYECNFCDMKKEEIEAVKQQIELYKKWRAVLQTGSFYRGRTFAGNASMAESCIRQSKGNITEWTCVSADQKKAVGFIMQKLVVPNTQFEYYKAKGLSSELKYHFYNRALKYNVKEFGDLVNTVSPIHIKQDSLIHDMVAKFVKMDGETEDLYAYGDTLMYGGVRLKQAFGATGYSSEVRHFPDFGSRLYFMEAE